MKKIVTFMVLGKVLLAQDLSPIIVNSEKVDAKTSLNQHLYSEELEDMVSNNGDISSLLKINPNVKVIENKSDPSDIKPAKIEINGAKYYQNNFIIDGLSADSLLDPISRNTMRDVEGNENEVFIDIDLIERISVFDSGISAEYGGFSGGVIDVKLKRPSATHSGKLRYRYTSDSFLKLHAPTNTNHTAIKPEYKKKTINATYSGPINDESGITLSFSQKESTKPKAYLDTFETVKSNSTNMLLKYTKYFDDDSLADVSIMHSPYKREDIKDRYTKDSHYTTEGGATSVAINYEKNFDNWAMDAKLSLKSSKNSRDSRESFIKEWAKTTTKPWGKYIAGSKHLISKEGSWGDIEKTQNSILSKVKFKRNFENHKINTGFEINHYKGTYKRDEELIVYKNAKIDSDIRCNGYTEDCVQHEQFFQDRDIYQKEDISASMNAITYYLEDSFSYENIDLNLGLRLDYNDYLKNLDIAPRFNPEISFFNKKTRFFGGLNRYYGKSFLAYKLREGRRPLKTEYRSSYQDEINSPNIPDGQPNPSVWSTASTTLGNKYVFSELDTPYTDEVLLGASQSYLNNVFKIKYVKRRARNQFSLEEGDAIPFTRPDGQVAYFQTEFASNKGSSDMESYSLNISSIEAHKIYSSTLSYSFFVSKNKSKTNFSSYDAKAEEDESTNRYIFYNGQIVDSKVVDNYDRPENYSMHFTFKTPSVEFFHMKGLMTNTVHFTYTPSYHRLVSTGANIQTDKGSLSVYENKKISDTKNIDLKIAFDTKFSKKKRLRLSADIFNVLDSVSGENENSYEIGRSFWLGAEYKF